MSVTTMLVGLTLKLVLTGFICASFSRFGRRPNQKQIKLVDQPSIYPVQPRYCVRYVKYKCIQFEYAGLFGQAKA